MSTRTVEYTRQLEIIPASETDTPILIIGAGGIGSPTCLTLAKMGFSNITCVDFDRVEPHNIPNQFFLVQDIGRSKVEALRDTVLAQTSMDIHIVTRKIIDPSDITQLLTRPSIVIAAVDSMTARRVIYQACKYNINCLRLIDCRTTYPYLRLLCVDTCSQDQTMEYEKTLHTSGEALRGRCTAQATFYTSLQSASLIAMAVQHVIAKQEFPAHIAMCFNPLQLIIKDQ